MNDTEDLDLLLDRVLIALGGTAFNLVEATGRREAAPAINVLFCHRLQQKSERNQLCAELCSGCVMCTGLHKHGRRNRYGIELWANKKELDRVDRGIILKTIFAPNLKLQEN
jgi:hypothetical protein